MEATATKHHAQNRAAGFGRGVMRELPDRMAFCLCGSNEDVFGKRLRTRASRRENAGTEFAEQVNSRSAGALRSGGDEGALSFQREKFRHH